ncbi:MAG: DivIVA domain-containing protein [Bifidobacteriaceae bacterium]|jgi:DivIVA domain-containing protein|nr:DivIVA domain-containing protein [Bifidobacteriaceae bacterium]
MTVLTLEDIKNVEFRPARLKEGYLADEVDKFIDDVIETFTKNQAAAPAPTPEPVKEHAHIASDSALLEKELKEKDEQIQSLEKELEHAKDLEKELERMKNLEKELQTAKALEKELEDTKADLVKAQAQNAQSSSDTLEEITRLTKDKDELTGKLQKTADEIDALNEKLSDYERQIKTLNSANQAPEPQTDEFRQKYEEQMLENSKLVEQINNLKEAASDAQDKEKISELENQLNITEMKLSKVNSELENAVLENAKNTEQVVKLRKTIQMYEEEPKTGATQAILNAGLTSGAEDLDQIPSMLLLATKLRDEYITKARTESEKAVNEANVNANEIVTSAKQKADHVLEKLEGDKKILEKRINDLRVFEADYRSRITKQLNQILLDLQSADNSNE